MAFKKKAAPDEDQDAIMAKCMKGGKSMGECLEQMGRGKSKAGSKKAPPFTKKAPAKKGGKKPPPFTKGSY